MRLIKAGAVLAALTLAGTLAACDVSPSSPSGSSGGSSTTALTISNENGALWTCDFSPFNGSDTLLSVGFVYETLAYVNPLQGGKATPMLATSWAWGRRRQVLTFTIRQGVTFSNGTPMSAADVAYTFNLLKKYPALDLTGVWSVLSSVTHDGRRPGHHGLQRPRRAVVLLHRRPDADRARRPSGRRSPTRWPTPTPTRSAPARTW